jgi:hypothetical protein
LFTILSQTHVLKKSHLAQQVPEHPLAGTESYVKGHAENSGKSYVNK